MAIITKKVECNVCCSDVIIKKIVECSCEYVSCQDCCKRYILSTNREPHCMNCKTEWSLRFLLDSFPKTWVNGCKKGQYRHHRKICDMDLEKAKIPEALAVIEERKEISKAIEEYREYRNLLVKSVWQIKNQIKKLCHERNICKDRRLKREILDELKLVRQEKNRMEEELRNLRVQRKETNGNFTYICPCPKDNCRGLVNVERVCTVCETKVCRRCLREKKDKHTSAKHVSGGHICNDDDIESVKLLKKDTKACPNCAIPIHRISGCPQMWCPICKVAFNWNTGSIETGTIHNPHAIEWMRQNGTLARDHRDVPCGGIDNGVLATVGEWYDSVYIIYQLIINLQYTMNNELSPARMDQRLLELRINYIKGVTSEEEWKRKIFLAKRDGERKRIKLQIYQAFQTISIETFRELHQSFLDSPSEKVEDIDKRVFNFFERMANIRRFINETFKKELPVYGCVGSIPRVTKQWYHKNRNFEPFQYDQKNIELANIMKKIYKSRSE